MKRMKTDQKRVLILSIALLLTLLSYFMMGESVAPAVAGDEGVVVYDFSSTTLIQATIENEQGSYRVIQEGDSYTISAVPEALLNRDYLLMILSDLTMLVAEEKIEDVSDLSTFGFDTPGAVIRAQYEDGTELVLLVGAQEPISGGYYVKRNDEASVYRLRKARSARFFMTEERFVNLVLIEPPGSRSPLAALAQLTVIRPDETIEISRVTEDLPVLMKASEAYGVASHMVTVPGLYRADETSLVRLSDMLLGLLADQAVSISPSLETLASYGFDNPSIRFLIRRDDRGANEVIELFVNQVEDRWYAMLEGVPAIYRLPTHIDFEVAHTASLISNRLPGPLLPDTKTLSVIGGESAFIFTLDHEDGLEVRLEDETIDSDAFRRFYKMLASGYGDPSERSGAEVPAEHPALRLVWELLDGETIELTFYSKSVQMAEAYLDGEPLFSVRKAFISAVLDAAGKVVAGESFETTW